MLLVLALAALLLGGLHLLCGHTGLLHAGDVVHEINGMAIHGFSVDQVANLMAGLQGTVVFKITPAISDCRPKRRTQVCVCRENL